MRMFLPALAILAAAASTSLFPVRAADNSFAPVAQLDIQSRSKDGVSFTAPESGTYYFTITSGSFCYLPDSSSPFGGWLTQVELHTDQVAWGNPDEWGKHPLGANAVLGDNKHYPTSAQAENAGAGSTVALTLYAGTKVTILVSDGSDWYFDNMGTVKVAVTTGKPAPIAPSAPAPTAPPTYVAPADAESPTATLTPLPTPNAPPTLTPSQPEAPSNPTLSPIPDAAPVKPK